MKPLPESVVELHELYHRKEGTKYIVGSPETGEFLYLSAAEFRAFRLFHQKLSYQSIQDLIHEERDAVDVDDLFYRLREKGFIHKIDRKIITPTQEPLHEFPLRFYWLGSRSAQFVFTLLVVFGFATLALRGTIPNGLSIFVYTSLTATFLTIIMCGWVLLFVRQAVKAGVAQSLGLQTKFGFANAYHLFVPKTYCHPVTEEQAKRIHGSSLLALLAATAVALMMQVYTASPFWLIAYTVAVFELLCECLLFMDTDLARFIASSTKVHQLNQSTKHALFTDLKLLLKGRGEASHETITTYAFFYMASIVFAIILLASFIIPALVGFIAIASSRFTLGHPLFSDALISLLFLGFNLILYGLALGRHHHLSHNTLFVNISLLAVLAGSYTLATVSISWLSFIAPSSLVALLCVGIGASLGSVFETSVRYAHPFSKYHGAFEIVLLPIIAACVPVSILFFTPFSAASYAFALSLGLGMLGVVILKFIVYRSHRSATANII